MKFAIRWELIAIYSLKKESDFILKKYNQREIIYNA